MSFPPPLRPTNGPTLVKHLPVLDDAPQLAVAECAEITLETHCLLAYVIGRTADGRLLYSPTANLRRDGRSQGIHYTSYASIPVACIVDYHRVVKLDALFAAPD